METISFLLIKQSVGTEIKVTATDAAGNESNATSITVIDKTAPSHPSVDKVTKNLNT